MNFHPSLQCHVDSVILFFFSLLISPGRLACLFIHLLFIYFYKFYVYTYFLKSWLEKCGMVSLYGIRCHKIICYRLFCCILNMKFTQKRIILSSFTHAHVILKLIYFILCHTESLSCSFPKQCKAPKITIKNHVRNI